MCKFYQNTEWYLVCIKNPFYLPLQMQNSCKMFVYRFYIFLDKLIKSNLKFCKNNNSFFFLIHLCFLIIYKAKIKIYLHIKISKKFVRHRKCGSHQIFCHRTLLRFKDQSEVSLYHKTQVMLFVSNYCECLLP